MKWALWLMLLAATPLAAKPKYEWIANWQGNVPELGGQVLVAYLRPATSNSSMPDNFIHDNAGEIRKRNYRIVIVRTGDATLEQITRRRAGFSMGAGWYYVRNGRGQMEPAGNDRELVGKIARWDAKPR